MQNLPQRGSERVRIVTVSFLPYPPNIACIPRTRPNFAGDLQHDLRDFQLGQRAATLALVIGEVADIYLRAAAAMGLTDDPIADCLRAEERFDLRAFRVTHDFLAAQWRAHHPGFALDPAALRPPPAGMTWQPLWSYHALLTAFQEWVRK